MKLRLPDCLPVFLEATQPNNLADAHLQVRHLLKHLQGIPFAAVLGDDGKYTNQHQGLKISNSFETPKITLGLRL